MNWERLRPGQREAIRVVMERVIRGLPYTAIVLPTRYGKTDVIRVAATELWREGRIAASLMLSPNALLRDQAAQLGRWSEALQRYGISRRDLKLKALSDVRHPYKDGRLTLTPNGEMFLSATMQLVVRNLDLFKEWVSAVKEATGLPVLIHVDESHMGGEDLAWGDAVKEIVEAGSLVVLYTATAVRSDGRRIPGFDAIEESVDPVVVTKVRAGSAPELVHVQVYDAIRKVVRLEAHHETTFGEAWNESPSPLCKIGRVPFDIDLSQIVDGVESGRCLLSELRAGEIGRLLGRIVRSPEVIEEGVRRFVREVSRLQQLSPEVAGIIFCGNDTDDERALNKHGKRIKEAIASLNHRISVVIATSADEEGKGKDLIESFSAGKGDVLIVKQMASLGLDVPRLKVLLDLSPVRTPAATIQRLMRIATPHGLLRTAVFIGPDDIKNKAIFQAMVQEMGGATSVGDMQLREEYEKLREDEAPTLFSLHDMALADFEDSDGNWAEKTRLAFVEEMLSDFPALLAFTTHAEIAKKAEKYHLTQEPAEQERIEDTGLRANLIREEVNTLVAGIISARLEGTEYSSELYGSISSEIFTAAYRDAGVPRGVRLGDITDLEVLRRIKRAVERVAAAREILG